MAKNKTIWPLRVHETTFDIYTVVQKLVKFSDVSFVETDKKKSQDSCKNKINASLRSKIINL